MTRIVVSLEEVQMRFFQNFWLVGDKSRIEMSWKIEIELKNRKNSTI
jgi:hypothetical protein